MRSRCTCWSQNQIPNIKVSSMMIYHNKDYSRMYVFVKKKCSVPAIVHLLIWVTRCFLNTSLKQKQHCALKSNDGSLIPCGMITSAFKKPVAVNVYSLLACDWKILEKKSCDREFDYQIEILKHVYTIYI